MKNVTMQISDEMWASLKETAGKRGVSIASLMKEATEMSLNFDPEFFLPSILEWSNALRLPPYLVIQNMCLSWLGRHDATAEAEGSVVLDEFYFTGKGPVTGKELYEQVKNKTMNDLAKAKAEKKS